MSDPILKLTQAILSALEMGTDYDGFPIYEISSTKWSEQRRAIEAAIKAHVEAEQEQEKPCVWRVIDAGTDHAQYASSCGEVYRSIWTKLPKFCEGCGQLVREEPSDEG